MKIPHIINKAARIFEVPPTAITGRQRLERHTKARQAVMLAAYTNGDYTLSEVGQAIGGRDHGTVHYGCRAAQNRSDTDEKYRAKLSALLEATK